MNINVQATALPEVLIIEPVVFSDHRGHFFESFNAENFEKATGVRRRFVQDNQSYSVRGVLRGLHYQIDRPQGKLVRVLSGAIFDVAVDIRKGSPTFGKWVGIELSAANRKQLWIPEGFAHGFLVLGDGAEVQYKTTDYRSAAGERAIRWDDPAISIDWPVRDGVVLSEKDLAAPLMREADLYP